jgi:hypothetical protein
MLFSIRYVIFFFFITGFLAGCRLMDSSAETSRLNAETQQKQPLKIIAEQRTFKAGERVRFLILNPTDSIFELASSRFLRIEHWKKREWQKVPYTPCECGRPCSPPGLVTLQKNQQIEIEWDQKAVRCEYYKGSYRPLREEQQVKAGIYRMVFNYINRSAPSGTSTYLLHFEFEIKKREK